MPSETTFFASARTDKRDWLVEADEPLAGLQIRSGGELPGIIAAPALLELVRKARSYGLRLARAIRAEDDREQITAWVEVEPQADGEGCRIGVANWLAEPLQAIASGELEESRLAIDRQLAELTARLDAHYVVLSVSSDAADLASLVTRMEQGKDRPWIDFVESRVGKFEQSAHWRVLDGAELSIPGSARKWRAVLVPLGAPEPGSGGFDLYLVPETPLPKSSRNAGSQTDDLASPVGRDIAPTLRQPISRIIANAETIRTQLAGPLAEEYSKYAEDIASAGEHLLALVEDLADLDVVEAESFTTAPDEIDLADVARRAAGILGVRASERGITIETPSEDLQVGAIGEFRRVLQILLNLLGNAIRYAPAGSTVHLETQAVDGRAFVTVADEGDGLTGDQQFRVFEKFERLGRSGDGGSGLGLYISRRLALAMDGELTVESVPGQGARFTLELPADTGN